MAPILFPLLSSSWDLLGVSSSVPFRPETLCNLSARVVEEAIIGYPRRPLFTSSLVSKFGHVLATRQHSNKSSCRSSTSNSGEPTSRRLLSANLRRDPSLPYGRCNRDRRGLPPKTRFNKGLHLRVRIAIPVDRCIQIVGESIGHLEAAQGNEPSIRARGQWQMSE